MLSTVPTTTRQWLLSAKPQDERVSTEHFTLKTRPLFDQPVENKILVKVLYFSNDPAQRTWMDNGSFNDRPYLPPVMQEGEKVFSGAIGEVIESYSPSFTNGDVVFGHFGWAEYALVDPDFGDPVKKVPTGITAEDFLCMDLSGQTAYYAFFHRAKATKDLNNVVINNAAGGVGSLLVQFAKKILEIPHVVAICGSDIKCEALKEHCGADVALNYKAAGFEKAFEEATPDYIDLYMDGIGGRLLDLGLRRIAKHGTIIVMGASSLYENPAAKAVSRESWSQMWCQRASILGFLILDYEERFKAMEQMNEWAKAGRIKLFPDVHEASFEEVPETWKGLFHDSTNKLGKRITKLR